MPPFSLFAWLTGGEPSAYLTLRTYSARTGLSTPPVVGDFTESAYAGYNRIPYPMPISAQPGQVGSMTLTLTPPTWVVAQGAHEGELVMGTYTVALREDLSEVVVCWEDLLSPYPMEKPGDQLQLTYTLSAAVNVVTVP